jgi:transcriptional regulator of acetoin/glycerol metabolism
MLLLVLILEAPATAPVRMRWERAAALGVSAHSDAHPVGTTHADLAVRRDRLDEVFREGRAILEPAMAQMVARSLFAVVADPEGVIVASHGGDAFAEGAARVRLVEGACWSERARGTNAIGTAIAEGEPVAVLGEAHYEQRNKGLFCYATPVRDAYGDLVVVLDVTGPMDRHDAAVGLAVQTAGGALEDALRALSYARAGVGALAAIERLVHRCGGPAMLVEASGVVRVANGAARAALPGLDRGVTCEKLFGVACAELLRLALGGGAQGMRFEARGTRYRVELDPIAGSAGRTLAVIVHLEAEQPLSLPARRSSAPPPGAPRTPSHPAFDAILGRDEGVVRAKEVASRFAATSLPVLLLAETGTGKELFARAIHGASDRAGGPFVPLNCGSLAPTLLEAELFGYAPGAFTGASRAGSEGRLGAAHGGTLFLDEVAEMPDALQAALLRVLDDGVYHRVGESRARKADFRLVCATCRDLVAMVETGRFRRDLFYRIQGACVTIPTLRDRTDRVWLAEALVAALALASARGPAPPLSEEARAWIAAHDWPGNVRELKSAVAHAIALGAGEPELTRDHFPRSLVASSPPVPAPALPASARTREQILRDAFAEAVRACDGNLSEAARRLGVARSTLYRTLRGDGD